MSDSKSPNDGVGQRKPQTTRYLWVVTFLIVGVTIIEGLLRVGLPVMYPFIQNEFGLSTAQVGLITSLMATGTGITAIFAGWLADNFGVKRILAIAMLVLTVSIWAFPLVNSYPLLLGLVVIIGIVMSPMPSAATRAVIDWFPIRIRALVMSVRLSGIPIASALAAAVLPTLAVLIGWRMAVAVTSLPALIIAVVFIFLYRDAPQGEQTVTKFNRDTLKAMARNRGLVITIIWGGMFVGLQFVTLSYFMLFLINELNSSPIMAGSLLAVAQVSSIIARVGWGAASDFIFRGRRVVILFLTGLLTVLWMLGASLASMEVPSITVYLMAVVMGISTLSFQGVFLTLIGEQAEPGQVGATVGVAMTATTVGMIVMPFLFGYLIDMNDSYRLAWMVTAAVALLGTLALLAFGKDAQHR